VRMVIFGGGKGQVSGWDGSAGHMLHIPRSESDGWFSALEPLSRNAHVHRSLFNLGCDSDQRTSSLYIPTPLPSPVIVVVGTIRPMSDTRQYDPQTAEDVRCSQSFC